MHSYKRSAACSALAIAILGCSAQLVAGVLPRSLAYLDLVKDEASSVFPLPHDASQGVGMSSNISDRGSSIENMEPGRIGTPFRFSVPVDIVKFGEATQVRAEISLRPGNSGVLEGRSDCQLFSGGLPLF